MNYIVIGCCMNNVLYQSFCEDLDMVLDFVHSCKDDRITQFHVYELITSGEVCEEEDE